MLEPLSGHEDCFSNELLHATQSLRSTMLLGSLNTKAWSQNGNMHVTFENASSGLQMHGIAQQSRNAKVLSGEGGPHQVF